MAILPRSPECGELARLLQNANAYYQGSEDAIANADATDALGDLLSAIEDLVGIGSSGGAGADGPLFDGLTAIEADGSFAARMDAVSAALTALGAAAATA